MTIIATITGLFILGFIALGCGAHCHILRCHHRPMDDKGGAE